MTQYRCILLGCPVDSGKRRTGCLMGPDAYRTAGLCEALQALGHTVEDRGNLTPAAFKPAQPGGKLHALGETIGWTQSLAQAAELAIQDGLPIFLGGDHSLSLGTVAGVAAHAATQDRPQFVLWLDAHSDYHTPETSDSGNLHGTPVAYFTGQDGFDGFPALPHAVDFDKLCMMGLRSVDPAERDRLAAS